MDARREGLAPLEVGDRFELLAMPEDPAALPTRATGMVRSIEYHDFFKSWQVFVAWDRPHEARSLMLVIPPDRVRKL